MHASFNTLCPEQHRTFACSAATVKISQQELSVLTCGWDLSFSVMWMRKSQMEVRFSFSLCSWFLIWTTLQKIPLIELFFPIIKSLKPIFFNQVKQPARIIIIFKPVSNKTKYFLKSSFIFLHPNTVIYLQELYLLHLAVCMYMDIIMNLSVHTLCSIIHFGLQWSTWTLTDRADDTVSVTQAFAALWMRKVKIGL